MTTVLLAVLFHIAAVDVKDVVASDDITFFVYTQTPVSIAIVGKTNIQALLHNELLKALDMG